MDVNELRQQSTSRLQELLTKTAAHVRDLRFTVGTRQKTQVRDLRKGKREVALIKTVLHEIERREKKS